MPHDLVDIYEATKQRETLADKLIAGEISNSERAELVEIDRKIHHTRQFTERRQIESLIEAGFNHGDVLAHPDFPDDKIIVRSHDRVMLEGESLSLLEATARITRKHNRSARVADWARAD